MIKLCTICARGGSKGVVNKNIRDLLGKPLIAHSIIQAKTSGLFDYIAVSSDSKEILQIAQKWGANICVERPAELATDQAPKIPVIQHCVREVEFILNKKVEIIVDLDATSPLRNAEDIISAVKLLEEKHVSNVITGMPARRSPYFNIVEVDHQGVVRLAKQLLEPIVRRQDAPKCYDMNASIYVWNRAALLENDTLFQHDTAIYIMPEERSIDIDSELDFHFVEYLAIKRGGD